MEALLGTQSSALRFAALSRIGQGLEADSRREPKAYGAFPVLMMGHGRFLNPAGGLLQKLSRRGTEFWECGNLPGEWQRSGDSSEEHQSFRQHDLKPCTGARRDCTLCQQVASPSRMEIQTLVQSTLAYLPHVASLDGSMHMCAHTNNILCHCCWVPLPLTMSLSHCGPCPLSVNYLLAVPSPLAAPSPRG